MKNAIKIKLIAIIGIVAIVGFAMAGCGNPSGGGGGGSGSIGDSVNLQNQTVSYGSLSGAKLTAAKTRTNFGYVYDWDNDVTVALTTLITGTPRVQINDGKLAIELDEPKSEKLETLTDVIPAGGASIIPADTKAFQAEEFFTSDGNYSVYLRKSDTEFAVLIYADRNGTVTGSSPAGDGWTNIWPSCSFTKGWNFALLKHNEVSKTTTITVTTTLPRGYTWTVAEY